MRWTCLLIGFLFLTFLPAKAGHSPPKVLLRVHVQTTGEGQPSLEVSSLALPPNGEQIMVRTLPEVTEHDLVDVQQDASGVVHLRLNHVGQVNLSAVTAQNQGRILVVLINGVVVYAPIIDQQIINGELDLPHPLNPQILLLLQEAARQNIKQAARS